MGRGGRGHERPGQKECRVVWHHRDVQVRVDWTVDQTHQEQGDQREEVSHGQRAEADVDGLFVQTQSGETIGE